MFSSTRSAITVNRAIRSHCYQFLYLRNQGQQFRQHLGITSTVVYHLHGADFQRLRMNP